MIGNDHLTAIDLFAGAGGLSLGLKAAGFHTVAAVEYDRDAAETYRQHVGADEVFAADARTLDFSRLHGVDVVAGGPPCQPFSVGGLRRGAHDARDLLPEFVRAVLQVRPRAFILENVPGLASKAHMGYLHDTLAPLLGLFIISGPHLLNAADYGVPQRRRRMVMVGMRDRRFTLAPGSFRHQPTPAGAVLTVKARGKPNDSIVTFAKTPDLRPSPYHGHLFNGGGRPINLDEPAPTMLASAGGNKTHWIDINRDVPPYHAHLLAGGQPREGRLYGARRLTVLESAALQTFPEAMTFSGPRSSQYTQVGNAVPVRLAQAVAEAVIEGILCRATRPRAREAVSVSQPVLF